MSAVVISIALGFVATVVLVVIALLVPAKRGVQ